MGVSRLKDSLFGEPALFVLAAATGLFLANGTQQRLLKRVMLVLCPLLFLSLFHLHVVSPLGDLFFRLWIPPAVIMAGAVGHAMTRFAVETRKVLRESPRTAAEATKAVVERAWPALFFLMLAGYAVGVAVTGGEHLVATAEHMRNRQNLAFSREQVDTLLTKATPQNRVLYTGTMPMAFFFAQGALQRGAVYYHPAYAPTAIASQWLARPDLRFAVVYNPLVYHPLLEGLDEKDQCISGPEYRFSPLDKPRRHGHILKEGFIQGDEFFWMAVHPGVEAARGNLRLWVKNPGSAQTLDLEPFEIGGNPYTARPVTLHVPARWNGWVEQELPNHPAWGPVKLTFPKSPAGLSIGGITRGPSPLRWPWGPQAQLTLQARDPASGRVVVSFDPARVLPPTLRDRKAVVIHDAGSSVLLELGR